MQRLKVQLSCMVGLVQSI
uniref:Uncharacterized protein n=1 Tax=Rhizophora mucronata TaxID=61149 RepID=A0A2P2PKN6_RHIMU